MATRRRKPPRPRSTIPDEVELAVALTAIVTQAKELVDDLLVPLFPSIEEDARVDARPPGMWPDDIAKAIAEARKRSAKATAKASKKAIARSARRINAKSKGDIKKQVSFALGDVAEAVDSPATRNILSAHAASNASLIRTLPERYLTEVEQLVLENFRLGRDADAMTDRLAELFDISKGRAQTIARDQTNKLRGQLAKARQQQAGITQFIWHTQDDERVRETHARVDDEIFTWEKGAPDGRGGRMFPGSEINCRCWSQPLGDVGSDDESEAA